MIFITKRRLQHQHPSTDVKSLVQMEETQRDQTQVKDQACFGSCRQRHAPDTGSEHACTSSHTTRLSTEQHHTQH